VDFKLIVSIAHFLGVSWGLAIIFGEVPSMSKKLLERLYKLDTGLNSK